MCFASTHRNLYCLLHYCIIGFSKVHHNKPAIMSSDDAPPVADAHVGTNLNLYDSVDAGVANFVDNYDLMGGEQPVRTS
jgi:hypothetical protein